jgi:hypothetical protein
MMTMTDVAPEFEDGFEEASTSYTLAKTQELRPDWLFPARWIPTARAPIRGPKKTISRGSVAKLLLPQRHFERMVYPTKGTRSIHHPGQGGRIKVGGQNGQDPKLAGNTPWERWRNARLRCRVGNDSALAGVTPLEKWKNARLTWGIQLRIITIDA